ncbi:MAG: hypothetical protein OEY20_17230 [Gemmatimonadota bacterium]|nr:hypothetical protein [Gemmatimonadota bacterium]
MNRSALLLLPLALACGGDRNPENSAVCGLAAMAAGSMILDQFQGASTVIPTAPPDLAGTVPARVVGRGTTRALVARTETGVSLGFEGEGFPDRPGFALVLVDDSSEVLRGVLIFEADGPADYPQIGTISSATSTLPLYAMRVNWGRVSNERCPLFAASDSTSR